MKLPVGEHERVLISRHSLDIHQFSDSLSDKKSSNSLTYRGHIPEKRLRGGRVRNHGSNLLAARLQLGCRDRFFEGARQTVLFLQSGYALFARMDPSASSGHSSRHIGLIGRGVRLLGSRRDGCAGDAQQLALFIAGTASDAGADRSFKRFGGCGEVVIARGPLPSLACVEPRSRYIRDALSGACYPVCARAR